jgi:creatinine amidohydrolase/Fe(II)-dependent formamide hydrolase-like protein
VRRRWAQAWAGALLLASLPFPVALAADTVFVEEMTWTEVREAIAGGRTVAIVPVGSTEQNGPHMVTGRHNVVVRLVAGRIARELGDALVYPVLPFAPTGDVAARSGHMAFPGSVSLTDATFAAVVREVATSAAAAGFRRVVLIGDHGGGQDVLQRTAERLDAERGASGVRFLHASDAYFKAADEQRRDMARRRLPAGAHAGVPDTSEAMAADRDGRLVRRDRLAPGGPGTGVDGDPRKASPELGEVYLKFKADAGVAQVRRWIDATR